ncbi:MAG: hypothetical protein U0Q12_25005 [Vicinamibacterales bacterium]
MFTSTLKTSAIVVAMSAATFGRVAPADAQPGRPAGGAAATSSRPATPSSPAAAKLLRVKMSLVVKGAYRTAAKADGLVVEDFADNSYSVEYVIPAETGEAAGLQKTNPLDPASSKEMADYQSKVRMRDARAYGSSADTPSPGAGRGQAANRGMTPMAMDPAVMAKVMACGKDKACQDRLVTEMMSQQMAASGVSPSVSAELQAASDACIHDKHQPMGSKGYEKCLDEEGRKRSAVKSRATDESQVPELLDRYLLFRVESDCAFKGHTRVNESTTRSTADIGGWREQAVTSKGEGDADPKGVQPCANEQAAFDTKTNTFWLRGLRPAAIPITSSGSDLETRTHTDVTLELPSEIADWIGSIVEGAPASGSKTETFGHRTATFTWSLTWE